MIAEEPKLNFSNTKTAFSYKSDARLKKAYWLFYSMKFPWLTKVGTGIIKAALAIGLPIQGIIRKTIFAHFCGGESIRDCEPSISELAQNRVGTILDYSVEGEKNENAFISTRDELLRSIEKAANAVEIPFSVFKITGIARFELLQKVQEQKPLTEVEKKEFNTARQRVDDLCKRAHEKNVRLLIDAEETWIQDAIDQIVHEMMSKYNREKAVVYNTIQFYRKDSLATLQQVYDMATDQGFFYGIKMVRGAYMEKERARAAELGYPSPIHESKADTDACYDDGLRFCMTHLDRFYICAGTHNETSSALLASLMTSGNISAHDERVFFAQLYGMSDHITFNLSHNGYNAAKYVPYGPVNSVMPYLFRRAEENTSIAGQTGRELNLIQKELKRRRE